MSFVPVALSMVKVQGPVANSTDSSTDQGALDPETEIVAFSTLEEAQAYVAEHAPAGLDTDVYELDDDALDVLNSTVKAVKHIAQEQIRFLEMLAGFGE